MDIFANLKKAIMDALQQTAGHIGEDFVSDLSYSGGGNINISIGNGSLNVVGQSLTFKIMDKSQSNKVIFSVDLPISASVSIPPINIPLNLKGEFKKS